VDRWAGIDALRRCIELVQATAGGELAEPPIDLWPEPTNPPRIFLRLGRVAQVLGVELPLHAVERCLVAIGATVVAKPEDQRIAVDVPGWRPDIGAEIDLVEEVARIHGYDEFPTELRRYRVGTLPDAPDVALVAEVRRGFVALGLLETLALPMGRADGDASVRLLNPLSAEDGYLRRSLLPGLVRQVEANWAASVRDVRLFEVGTVFAAGAPGARPAEELRAAGVVTGGREPAHWASGQAAPWDRWDAKGFFEAAITLAVPGATVQVEGAEWVARTADGRVVGRAGQLAADAPLWASPVFGFEVSLDLAPRQPVRFRPLPSTPSSGRDVALLIPDGTAAGRVVEVVRGAGRPLLESVDILSEFRGGAVPAGARSVALHLTFRAADRTLAASEVDAAEAAILAALHRELGIQRREALAPGAGE
jgi:phenylalanyl-tRNA synthetase beta chain